MTAFFWMDQDKHIFVRLHNVLNCRPFHQARRRYRGCPPGDRVFVRADEAVPVTVCFFRGFAGIPAPHRIRIKRNSTGNRRREDNPDTAGDQRAYIERIN